MDSPREGFSTEVRVLRVIDADTIEVEIKRRFPVRLVEENAYFDAPELKTLEGKKAANWVKQFLLKAKKIILFVPAGKSDILTDINSFNRILGELWVDGEKLTDIIREQGFIPPNPKKKK